MLGLLRWWTGGLFLAIGSHICADATISVSLLPPAPLRYNSRNEGAGSQVLGGCLVRGPARGGMS
jgi:hypothetical protein